jgi:hypothetical protein
LQTRFDPTQIDPTGFSFRHARFIPLIFLDSNGTATEYKVAIASEHILHLFLSIFDIVIVRFLK